MSDDDFYEDDEPVTDVIRRFEEGEKHVTTPPSQGTTERAAFGYWPTPALSSETNHTSRELAGR
ncbi:hypothetical protein [Streptomyces sp. SID12501]|uniref:Uncharacterized protein n=1 Tax=Streptomyces sp. SID12501 TaxID=2706042 RepID=A0A6B3C5V6_9ACTN|nr:hypothetical protein [Streptomyces sp. SID12501]NEC92185.1 hypothetical protein [Streptomyces sp. SID12501]